MNVDGYSELANAVVVQATEDWRNAMEKLRKMKHSRRRDKKQIIKSLNRKKDDCENFFKSAWFTTLTNLDGKQLLKDLKKEEEAKQKAKFNVSKIAG